jgi:hypothetical protein
MIEELTNFPKWKFDDLCDGLYLAVKVVPGNSGTPVVTSAGTAVKTTAQKIINMARRW